MVRNSPENKLSQVAGSIETKTISASNLKLKLTEAELGNTSQAAHRATPHGNTQYTTDAMIGLGNG